MLADRRPGQQQSMNRHEGSQATLLGQPNPLLQMKMREGVKGVENAIAEGESEGGWRLLADRLKRREGVRYRRMIAEGKNEGVSKLMREREGVGGCQLRRK